MLPNDTSQPGTATTNGTLPADSPESAASGRPAPSADALARQVVELERHYPPPDLEAIKADCRWLQEHWGTELLAPYRGTHVAVLNGAIIGSGANSLQLELDLSRKFGVHPQRLVIEHIPAPPGV